MMISIRDKLGSQGALFALASFNWFLLGVEAISRNVSTEVTFIVVVFFVVIVGVQLAIAQWMTRLILLTSIKWSLPHAFLKSGFLGLFLTANMVAFLAGEDASFITGQAYNVNGGQLFH